MFGTTIDSTTSKYNSVDASEDDDNKPKSIGSNTLFEWERMKIKLDHDYSITG